MEAVPAAVRDGDLQHVGRRLHDAHAADVHAGGEVVGHRAGVGVQADGNGLGDAAVAKAAARAPDAGGANVRVILLRVAGGVVGVGGVCVCVSH